MSVAEWSVVKFPWSDLGPRGGSDFQIVDRVGRQVVQIHLKIAGTSVNYFNPDLAKFI